VAVISLAIYYFPFGLVVSLHLFHLELFRIFVVLYRWIHGWLIEFVLLIFVPWFESTSSYFFSYFRRYFRSYFWGIFVLHFLGRFLSDFFGGFTYECLVPLLLVISCPQAPGIALDLEFSRWTRVLDVLHEIWDCGSSRGLEATIFWENTPLGVYIIWPNSCLKSLSGLGDPLLVWLFPEAPRPGRFNRPPDPV